MPRPRKTDQEKRLAGTFREGRDEASVFHGRTRLETELPPPSDLDPDAQREWRIHMRLCCQAGTLSHTALRGFTAMVKAAAAMERSYTLAMKTGPMVRTQDGVKSSPAWTGYQQASKLYLQWSQQFGLLPMQARLLPQLPPATGGRLRVVHGDT